MHRSHQVTTPQLGLASFASAVISPACDMPISITAISCSGSSFSSCSGRPKWLLRLPCDFRTLMPGRQNVRDDFLGGRLAGRAGYADQRLAPDLADGRLQAAAVLPADQSTASSLVLFGKAREACSRATDGSQPHLSSTQRPRSRGHRVDRRARQRTALPAELCASRWSSRRRRAWDRIRQSACMSSAPRQGSAS